ncbi:MAG: hypothetical protein ABIN48_05020 [Ginsengibacter sp.]
MQNTENTIRETLEKNGYTYEGVQTDRRGKKYNVYMKDGKTYHCAGLDIPTNEIKLRDISDVKL